MAIIKALIKKEAIHIVRDRRTMIITLLMPLVLLLLFGFAISTEVNDVRLVAVVGQHNDDTRDILERFRVNRYFTFQGLVAPSEVEEMLRSGRTDAAVYLQPDNGHCPIAIVVDASNTTSAQAMTMYIRGVIDASASRSPVLTYTLYNPQMKSAYNFVPGIMGMIFILICAIMTSVSIVREKENGTMDLLLVSPVRPATIILGKLVPYFVLSCVILAIMLGHGLHRAWVAAVVERGRCSGHIVALYRAVAVDGAVGVGHCHYATYRPDCVGRAVHASGHNVVGHDISDRQYAGCAAVAFVRHSGAVVHRGDAQADDPAARYRLCGAGDRDTPVDDGSVARTCR